MVAVVVVAAIAWFAVGMNHGGAGSPESNTVAGTQTSAAPMSLKDLFTAGVSQTCTFSNNDGASSGKIYLTAGHMRGDFTSTSNGETVTSHMITDGTTSYVWTDNPLQGFKMSFASMTSASSSSGSATASHPGSPDVNQPTNFSCTPGSVDQSEFTLPTNVTFQDLSAMMNVGASAGANAGTSAGSGNSQQCAMCAQAPNAQAKAACLSALHCQ